MASVKQDWPFPWRGIHTEISPRYLKPDMLRYCEDMYYPQPDLLEGRGSFTQLKAQTAVPTPIYKAYFWPRDGHPYFADLNHHLWYHTAGGAVLVPGTAANVTDMVAFGPGAGPLLYVAERLNAGHTLHTWNTIAYAQLVGTNVPNVMKLMVRYGRLWGTCEDANPSLVYFSDVSDATTWSGLFNQGGFFPVASGQDGAIVDWIDFNGVLYVFKQHGIYRVTGDHPSTFAAEKVAHVANLIPGTIADCVRGVMYTTTNGVYVLGFSATERQQVVSYPIARELQDDLQNSSYNWINATYSQELDAYLLAVGPSDSTAGRIWVSNLGVRPDVWTTFPIDECPTLVYQGNHLYLGCARGDFYQYGNAHAGGSPHFMTGYWDFGDVRPLKCIDAISGPINAGNNATATVKVHGLTADGDTVHEVTYNVDDTKAKLLNFNCLAAAVEVEYA